MAADKRTPEELELQALARLDAAGLVQLDPDHPGFRDPVYRARRDAIARIAFEYSDGEPVPRVDYTDEEQEVWRAVWRNLGPLHDRYACSAYLGCSRQLKLDRARVPQLADVNVALDRATGFRMRPVAGLVSDRNFLGHLGRSEDHAELRPLDLPLVASPPSAPTDYQKVLYVAPDLPRPAELLTAWLREI